MKYLLDIFKSEKCSGILSIISAIIAMSLANIDYTRDIYHSFLKTPIVLQIGTLTFNKNILLCINDALMSVFFLFVGLEIKKEILIGLLSSYRQAIFPIIAAIGGMFMPILIYLAFNLLDPVARDGWAIPATTDIVFALSVLSLLGNQVPETLKIFLMTLAVIDDICAIIIIAIFYNSNVSIFFLIMTIIMIMLLMLLNFFEIYRVGIYIFLGLILWVVTLKSGIHTTLAGVIVGILIPTQKEKWNKSSAQQLRNMLHPWVTFFILPLFAFSNAGVTINNISINQLVSSALPIGIIIGLLIGKPLGITFFCWLAMKFNLIILPQKITLQQVAAVSILCGIGFTMSIFISALAFNISLAPNCADLAKLGILIGSSLSAIVGYSVLKLQLGSLNT